MSDTPSHGPVKSIMPKWIRGPQDFVGGLALMAIAVFALWASSDLQGMRGFSFGAGTAPRMFGFLLLGLGIAVTIVGLVTEGEHIATYAWRGPLFVSLAILVLCGHDPPDGPDLLGIRELHDFGAAARRRPGGRKPLSSASA